VAYEVDPDLAADARGRLADRPNVRVEAGDAGAPPGRFDLIYVNAGATRARREWLAALSDGGRMFLPITAHVPMFQNAGIGLALHIARNGREWPVRVVSEIGIYDCRGAREPSDEPALREFLSRVLRKVQPTDTIRSLTLEPHERTARCLAHLEGFCLQS
jgi:hypothetical protein